jgi:hypothetical protein
VHEMTLDALHLDLPVTVPCGRFGPGRRRRWRRSC